MKPSEIVFEVSEATSGSYNARAVGHSIFTQGHEWTDLKAMVKDAVLCHFDDDEMPVSIRIRSSAGEITVV